MNFLKGKVKLAITYWVFGVIPALVYKMLEKVVDASYPKILMHQLGYMFILIFVIFPFIYFPFVYVAIWNSSHKYTKNKILASLARITVIIWSIFLILYAINVIDQLFVKSSSTENFSQELNLLNRKLPMKIDKETELVKISYDNKKLSYHYRLINYEASKINISDFSERMKANLLKKVCSSENLKPFIVKGVNISFNYEGKKGNAIQNIIIKPSDCKQVSRDKIDLYRKIED